MAVKALCEISLKQYPTSYQEDLDLLESDEKEKQLTQNERSCVLFRSGEKKILHFLIDASDKIQHLFTLSLKEARRYVNIDTEYSYDPIMSYLTNFVFSGLQQKETKQVPETKV